MTETAASLTDEAARLFDEFRSGRRDGLDALVRLLTPTLWHLARACGLERADAEDVVQQAWMQLVAKADTVRDPQSVVAWVGTTVRREAPAPAGPPETGADETQQIPAAERPETAPGPAPTAELPVQRPVEQPAERPVEQPAEQPAEEDS